MTSRSSAVEEPVDAGVADVEHGPVVGATGRDHGQPGGGRAHAGLLGVPGDRLAGCGGWPAARAATMSSRRSVGAAAQLAAGSSIDDAAGDLAGRVPTHAVGDDEDACGRRGCCPRCGARTRPTSVAAPARTVSPAPTGRSGTRAWSPGDPHGLHELLERLVLDSTCSPPTEPVTCSRSTTWPRRAPGEQVRLHDVTDRRRRSRRR